MRTRNLLLSLLFLFSLVITTLANTTEVQAASQVGQGSFNRDATGDQTIVIASYINDTSFYLPVAKRVWSENAGGGMYVIYIVVDTQQFLNYAGGQGQYYPLYLSSGDYYAIVYLPGDV